ncbi:MAG TPA: S8 family serine peptidase [Gammaproteobacteria bacterium]
MTNVRSQILALAAAALTTVAAADELDGSRKHASPAADYGAEPRVIVKLRSEGAGASEFKPRNTLESAASRSGFKAKNTAALGARLHVLEVEPAAAGESIEATLARLNADPAVEYAELDRRRYLHAVPDDPLYAQQWYLQAPSVAPSATDAERAWDITAGSDDVVVAILDTGVLYDHPDLQGAGVGGRLLPGYDFIASAAAANDGDGRDSDATDAGDWVTAQDAQTATFAGCQATTSSWHGTRVAGIIGARSNNATGIAGTTWQPWLLPVRVVGKCGGRDSDILAAMLWAAGIHVDGVPDNPYPAKVLNISFGANGPCSQAYQDVIEQIAERGAVAIISAGNEGGPVASPANCRGVAAVAGLRHVGTKVGYSSLGRQVALSAPAGNCVNTTGACLYSIVTATNTGTTTPTTHSYADQLNFNVGTSFSAPIVSGIAALMASVNENLDSSRLIERLQEGAAKPFPVSPDSSVPQCHVPLSRADIQDSECNCTTDTCGAGIANAPRALEAALRPVAEVTVSGAFTPGGSIELSGLTSVAALGRSVVAYHWSLPCGSGNFAPPDSAVTVIDVPAADSFTLRLAITDDAGRVDRADVVVTPTRATRSPGTALADGCAPVEVTVSPATSSVQTHSTQTFTATVANAADTTVTWQVNGVIGGNATVGTISATGTYTAPASVPSPATVTVSAISNQDSTRSDSASVTISSVLDTVVVPTSSDGGSGAIDTAALLALLVAALGRQKRNSAAAKGGCR